MAPIDTGIHWKVGDNSEYVGRGCDDPLLERCNDGLVCDVADYVSYLEQNLETADSDIYSSWQEQQLILQILRVLAPSF
jgi:hypothetical protein